MGSRQSTGKAGNAARNGVRVIGVALTQQHTLPASHVFADDTTRSRLWKCDGGVRLLAAELKRLSDTFQSSGPLPGFRPFRQWCTEALPLHTLKRSCDHYYHPSRVRLTHDLAPLCDIHSQDAMCLTKVL
jgi:hypothetical protein